jgi:hypothetical protein
MKGLPRVSLSFPRKPNLHRVNYTAIQILSGFSAFCGETDDTSYVINRMESSTYLDDPEENRRLLQQGIDTAIRKRDYKRAAMLQECLRNLVTEAEQLRKEEEEEQLQVKIEQLQREREAEQLTVCDFVNARLHTIHARFKPIYDEIEAHHQRTLASLQYKLSGPEYKSMRYSPDIRALERAEAFFAKQKDFKSAGQVRIQIQRRSAAEAKEFEANMVCTIESKVRDAVTQYTTKQKAFVQRLYNEKNILKRDCDRQLLLIENKHRKILHKWTGMAETSFDLTTVFRTRLHTHIDTDIRDFADGLQIADTGIQSESTGSEVFPPKEPRRARSARVSRRPASARSQEPRQRNPRVKAAIARAQKTVRISDNVGYA